MPQAILSAQSWPLRSPAELPSIITTVYERIERDRHRNCWIYVRPIEEALAEADALVQRTEKGSPAALWRAVRRQRQYRRCGYADNGSLSGIRATCRHDRPEASNA